MEPEGVGAGDQLAAQPDLAWFGNFLEYSPDATVIQGPGGRIVFVNAQMERLFGYRREELLGKTVECLMPPRFRDKHVALRAEYSQEPRLRAMGVGRELVGLRKDGSEVPIEVSLSPLRRGADLFVMSVIRDISERRQVEQTLSAQAALLDLAHDAIFMRDLKTDAIRYWNHGADVLYGWAKDQAVGQVSHVLLQTQFPEPLQKIEAQLFQNGRWEGELIHTTHPGQRVVVQSVWSVQRDETGEPVAVLEVNRDVTARKRIEEERERLLGEVSEQREHAEALVKELQHVNGALRTLIDTIPAGVMVADAAGRFTMTNAATNAILGGAVTGMIYGPHGGYTLHQLDGTPIPWRDLPLPRAVDQGETTHDVELLVRRDGGTDRVILAAASPQRDAAGKVTGAVAILQDITERKQMEEALRASEERLRLITSHSPDAMSYADRDLRYVWVVNPQPPLTEETMVGKTDFDFLPPDQAERLTAIKRRALETGQGSRQVLHLTIGGKTSAFDSVYAPRRDSNGQIIGIFGYIRNVTERERLLQEIEIERGRLRTILEGATNAIVYLDETTGRVEANPEAARLFGHPFVPEAGWAQCARQIHYPDGRSVPARESLSNRARLGQASPRQEMLIIRPDGSRVPVMENAAPVRRPDHAVSGIVVVFQDISALKELERLREEWTSIIAHDLRQPITIIKGYAGLLERQSAQLPPAAKARVDHILASARQLDRMIGDLLDASRIETRRLTLECETIDLAALVGDVVERTGQITRGHEVRVEVNGDIPSLLADPVRIEQIIGNLLSNAAKYAYPETPIAVAVKRQTRAVEVAVTNRGEGISPAQLSRLFTRYYRTPEARNSSVGGLGLGLYITKGLVEAHGGRIWAKSTPYETTTFTFTLPIAASP